MIKRIDMKEEDNGLNVFIVAIIILGLIGVISAFTGITISTVELFKKSTECGLVALFLDLFLVVFVLWSGQEGIIEPLKKRKR